MFFAEFFNFFLEKEAYGSGVKMEVFLINTTELGFIKSLSGDFQMLNIW